MKNIYLNIFKFNKKILNKSSKMLGENKLIGVPTETVYGLAGNAYSKTAINKIYKIKGRPKKNPIIIHYYNLKRASLDVEINNKFLKIYKSLCPGPITFVLKKKRNSKISSAATANLDTVAIRFPKNLIIRSILKKIKFPLAIPSANKSSGISPICALDVNDEFKKKKIMIIDGGQSKLGIESTVLDLTEGAKLLRPGIISFKKIARILNHKISTRKKIKKIKSPGQLKKHYSPGIPMYLNKKKPKKNFAFITFGGGKMNAKNIFQLSKNSNLEEAAKNLYKTFRLIKKLKYKKIYVSKIPNKGVGIAINDRLKRASN